MPASTLSTAALALDPEAALALQKEAMDWRRMWGLEPSDWDRAWMVERGEDLAEACGALWPLTEEER
jgi:hypothetical protein